jgi:hypothetical protein
MRSHPTFKASINDQRSMTIPSIDSTFAIDPLQVTHLEDSIMDAIVCQAAEVNTAEIIADAPVQKDSISTLSSTEMSFVGGGQLVVCFA